MKPPHPFALWSKKVGLALGFFALLLAPGIVIGLVWVENAGSVFLFGALPAAVAVFGGNLQLAPKFAVLTAASGALAFIVAGNTILSTLVLATVAGLVGFTARRGHQSPGLMMVIFLGFLIVSPPLLFWRESGEQIAGTAMVIVGAALLLAGGLWAYLIGFAIRSRIPAGREPVVMESSVVIPYALALFVSTGLATFFALDYGTDGLGAWIILTVIIVVQPEREMMRSRVKDRVLGTLMGGFIALVVLLILQVLNWQSGYWQLGFAFLFIAIAMSYFQSGPYWKYVIYLTPGIILLDSNHATDQFQVLELRVLFTVVGAVIAVLVAVGVRTLAAKANYSGS